MIASIRSLFGAGAALLLAIPLAANAADNGPPPGGKPPAPPPEAIAACKGKTEGATASFTGRNGETLTGTYKGLLGDATVTGTIKGSDVKFSIKGKLQEEEVIVTYTGKVEGKDSMKGTVKFGDVGEGTWTAKK